MCSRELPDATAFREFTFLFGGFDSVFGRLGNSRPTSCHFNGLSVSGRSVEQPGTGFCQYFPVDEGNRRSRRRAGRRGDASRPAVPNNPLLAGAADVLHCHPQTRESREEGRVTATGSLGRRL